MSVVGVSTALTFNQPVLERFHYHSLGSVTSISAVIGGDLGQLAHSIAAKIDVLVADVQVLFLK